MTRGVRWYLVGSVVLVALIALAGCSHFMLAERESWRHDAEIACLNSGAVKESPARVRISSISGPGACGADYPLRVSALGESGPLGYSDEAPVPPGVDPQRIDAAALAGDAAERSADVGRQFATAAAAASGRAAIVSVAAVSAAAVSAAGLSAAPSRIIGRTAGRRCRSIRPACAARRRRGFGRARRPAASLLRRPRCALHAGAAERRATVAAARTAARTAGHRLGRTGRSETGGDARLPDRLHARSMDHRRGAAGGAEMVPPAGGGDQTNLRLFVPRHERQSERAYFRARLRQCARHRRVHAGRRPQNHGAIRLARHAGGAGIFCTTCRRRRARISPPCWRPAPTSITTITSTSI